MKDTQNKKVYAILDYDGFICKSFFANKDNPMDICEAKDILHSLKESAIDKTSDFFNVSKSCVEVLPVMSEHSWKKDIYPSYKRTRKRNEYLGVYRDECKKEKDIVSVGQLEADEVIVCLSDWFRSKGEKFIVFSDDKDLRYYSEMYCKINITEEVQVQDSLDIWKSHLEQMLIGDKEDNIQGIPKIGEKTAPKLLESYGYGIEGVVNCFKDKGVNIDNCLRDLLLIIPLSKDYLNDAEASYDIAQQVIAYREADELAVNRAIISQVQYLNEIVTRIYN